VAANLQPSDYKPDTLPLCQCILIQLSLWHLLLHFLAVSFVTGSRIFRPYLFYWLGFSGHICSYWPGFSGCFCCYWPRDFPAVSIVACWDFPALTFLAWECKKVSVQGPEGRDFPVVSGVSGRDFMTVTFLAWGILKNSMGSRQIVLTLTAGFSVLNMGIFWREAKTKRFLSPGTLQRSNLSCFVFGGHWNIAAGCKRVKTQQICKSFLNLKQVKNVPLKSNTN
jgi:hypothetical protein